MIRPLIKTAAARAISLTRLDRAAQLHKYRHTPFVMGYHRVVEQLDATHGYALPAMEISVSMLEQHLEALGRQFEFVAIDDFDRKAARPRAILTFDDGYRDVYDFAFPLLKRKGIPAAFFVVTDLIDSDHIPLHEQLHALLVKSGATDAFSQTQRLLAERSQAAVQDFIATLRVSHKIDDGVMKSLQPMTWKMLAEMRDAGMTIASHSMTHAILPNESAGRVRVEVAHSRQQLQQNLGIHVRSFAYPGGAFTPDVVDAVAAAGYRYAFTTCTHRDARHPLLTIPRTGLWERSCLDTHGRFSPAIMSCQAAGAFRPMSRCQQSH